MKTEPIHILGLGQSNLASHGIGRNKSSHGKVLFEGNLESLQDPIPGGTGSDGSIWPIFANLLSEMKYPSDFTLSLMAQGGTSVKDWAPGGKCNEILHSRLSKVKAKQPSVNWIVWHQGERDTLLQTSQSEYVTAFSSLHSDLALIFPHAGWIICRGSFRMGKTSKEVIAAQNHIAGNLSRCLSGPNTDDLGEQYRRDGTHFNAEGLDAFAKMIFDVIVKAQ